MEAHGNCELQRLRDRVRGRETVVVNYDGAMVQLARLAEIHGIKLQTLRSRLSAGQSLHDALTMPAGSVKRTVRRR